jgi:hypothetical protein
MRVITDLAIICEKQSELVASLTDGAKLRVNQIHYDDNEKVLTLPIRRIIAANAKGRPRTIASGIANDRSKLNESRIVIRKIQSYSQSNLCGNNVSEITILFGVKVDENEIYISSAEELSGELMFELLIKVSEVDIEISDYE